MEQQTNLVLKKLEEPSAAAISSNPDFLDFEKQVPRMLNNRYELKEELGKGAHGKIYSGRDKLTKTPIAVKLMEKISKNKSKYIREISLMKDMNKSQQIGFPKLHYYAADKNYYYIVMEQLNHSLKELKDQSPDHRFTIKTVTMIGLQLLSRLESIHKLNYIHRDLKPANIMTGRNKSDSHIIYLIDFGLTKKQNQISNIPHNEAGNKVVGTAIYAGINAHMPSSNYYKKDDLESLMYVLCYLCTGTLPWKNCKPSDAGLDKMMKMKVKISPYDLFYQMPIEYAQVLENIKSTPQEATCDYRYIESMLKSVAYNLKFKIDYNFEWLSLKRQVTQERKQQDTYQNLSAVNLNNGELRQDTSMNFVQFQNDSIKILDSAVVNFEASRRCSLVSKNQTKNKNQSNNDLLMKCEVEQQEKPHRQSSKTLGQPNSKLSDMNLQQVQNFAQQEDQGGLALPAIQEIQEEEKIEETKNNVELSAYESHSKNEEQVKQIKEKKKEKRIRKIKEKQKEENNMAGSYSRLMSGTGIQEVSPAQMQNQAEGKFDINVTVNINKQDQIDNKDQSQVVQMTFNRDNVVNVHVHINGNSNSSLMTPQINMKQSSYSKAENNISNFCQQNEEAQEDQQMEEICYPNINNEIPFDSGTFEEFENGILSETQNELIVSQQLEIQAALHKPRTFETHSNQQKMKDGTQLNQQQDDDDQQ